MATEGRNELKNETKNGIIDLEITGNSLIIRASSAEMGKVEEKMAIAAPVCTANWQYFKAGGPSLGGWGTFKDTEF